MCFLTIAELFFGAILANFLKSFMKMTKISTAV